MDILIRPIITEKATAASEDANCFAFEVDKRANKVEIKKAVESFYGVNVDAVRTMIVAPKKSVRHTRAGMIVGKKNSYKKAIVQVRSGEVIDLYSNI
jgi:large subunit ribosomal protein L23